MDLEVDVTNGNSNIRGIDHFNSKINDNIARCTANNVECNNTSLLIETIET